MRSTTVRQFTVGLAAIATVAGLAPAALAQSPKNVVSGLQENQDLIRQCRRLNQTAEVFDNTNLGPITNRLATLQAGDEVTLTGVVLRGGAQIFLKGDFDGLGNAQPVGWINATFLSPCGSNPSPGLRDCFRADVPLDVRSTPSSSGNPIYRYQVGDTFAATTVPSRREFESGGRSWLEVITVDGITGWVVETTPSGQVNARKITCP